MPPHSGEKKSNELPPNFSFTRDDPFYVGPATCNLLHYTPAAYMAGVIDVAMLCAASFWFWREFSFLRMGFLKCPLVLASVWEGPKTFFCPATLREELYTYSIVNNIVGHGFKKQKQNRSALAISKERAWLPLLHHVHNRMETKFCRFLNVFFRILNFIQSFLHNVLLFYQKEWIAFIPFRCMLICR